MSYCSSRFSTEQENSRTRSAPNQGSLRPMASASPIIPAQDERREEERQHDVPARAVINREVRAGQGDLNIPVLPLPMVPIHEEQQAVPIRVEPQVAEVENEAIALVIPQLAAVIEAEHVQVEPQAVVDEEERVQVLPQAVVIEEGPVQEVPQEVARAAIEEDPEQEVPQGVVNDDEDFFEEAEQGDAVVETGLLEEIGNVEHEVYEESVAGGASSAGSSTETEESKMPIVENVTSAPTLEPMPYSYEGKYVPIPMEQAVGMTVGSFDQGIYSYLNQRVHGSLGNSTSVSSNINGVTGFGGLQALNAASYVFASAVYTRNWLSTSSIYRGDQSEETLEPRKKHVAVNRLLIRRRGVGDFEGQSLLVF